MYFFVDKICYKVINHGMAEYILKFSEFEYPYATMVVSDNLKKPLKTQPKEVNKSSILTEAKVSHADKAKSPDDANKIKKSRDI